MSSHNHLQHELLHVIDDIYAAATDPSQWEKVTTSICRLLGVDFTNLTLFDHQNIDVGVVVNDYFGEDEKQLYINDYSQDDLWAVRSLQHVGHVRTSEQLATQRDFLDSRFYQDLLAKYDIRHGAGCFLHASEAKSGMISIQNIAKNGVIEAEQAAVLQTLIPHLQRAFDIHDKIYQLKASREITDHFIAKLSIGLVLLNAQREIVYLNEMAEKAIQHTSQLLIADQCLRLADRKLNKRFNSLLDAVYHPTKLSSAGGILSLSTNGVSLGPQMIITRYQADPVFDVFAKNPIKAAVLLVNDHTTSGNIALDALCQEWGLTRREQQVLSYLLQGLSPAEISEQLAITRDSVKYHLKNLFSKTGTQRQSELVMNVLNWVARTPSL